MAAVPDGAGALQPFAWRRRQTLVYNYDATGERTGITGLLQRLPQPGLRMNDVATRQSSLEDIFVELVGEAK